MALNTNMIAVPDHPRSGTGSLDVGDSYTWSWSMVPINRTASLSWYDHPASHQAVDDFWRVLRDALRRNGLSAPDTLDRTTPIQTQWRNPNLLLAQCCSLDLFTAPGRSNSLSSKAFAYWQKWCWGTEDMPVGFIMSTGQGELSQASVAFRYVLSRLGLAKLRTSFSPKKTV